MRFLWLTLFCVTFIWSSINPADPFIWALEVAPAVIGLVLLSLTYQSFRLTPLLYLLILGHCLILMIGGHYTYEQVPFFNDLKSILGFERNNYDKVGHFVQGFVPAMIAREILIRKQIITQPGWRDFLIICICLAFSAFYELIEWLVAVISGESAQAFLGTQGYVWDTQTDMAFALLGAVMALLCLSRIHDQQLGSFTKETIYGKTK